MCARADDRPFPGCGAPRVPSAAGAAAVHTSCPAGAAAVQPWWSPRSTPCTGTALHTRPRTGAHGGARADAGIADGDVEVATQRWLTLAVVGLLCFQAGDLCLELADVFCPHTGRGRAHEHERSGARRTARPRPTLRSAPGHEDTVLRRAERRASAPGNSSTSTPKRTARRAPSSWLRAGDGGGAGGLCVCVGWTPEPPCSDMPACACGRKMTTMGRWWVGAAPRPHLCPVARSYKTSAFPIGSISFRFCVIE